MANSRDPRGDPKSGDILGWSPDRLRELELDMESRVGTGCASANEDEVAYAEVLGYWMYRLKECRVKPAKATP